MVGIFVEIDNNGNIIIDSLSKEKMIREKGKSIIDFPNEYIVIDIETTGLDPTYDDIIEIAAVKVQNDVIIDTFQSLIHIDYELDDFITKLTGITNEMLSNAPKLKFVLNKFYDFIGDSILLGHNINFDINFLYDSLLNNLNIKLKNDFIDTLRIARKHLKELKHHRLEDICCYYNIPTNNMHRSLIDCKNTLECYLNFKKSINDINEFKKLFKSRNIVKSKNIVVTDFKTDEDSIFYNKIVVFTGTLEKMQRKDAMQIIANIGGINADSVTSKTNFLILGNYDYCSTIKDGKSSKHKKAEELKLKGNDIEIISENVFYELISNHFV